MDSVEWTLSADSPRFEPLPEVLPGLMLRRRPTITIKDYRGFDLWVELTVNDVPRVEIWTLQVARTSDGQKISTESLRSIATQWIVNRYVRQEIELSFDLELGKKYAGLGILAGDDALRMKRQGPTAETIEWVAKIYRLADLVGDGPTKSVEETFQVSRSTAGNWIGRARSAGLITPTAEGSS